MYRPFDMTVQGLAMLCMLASVMVMFRANFATTEGDDYLLCDPENCCESIDVFPATIVSRDPTVVTHRYGILRDQLTEPGSWQGGEAEWWVGLNDIMKNGGPGTAGYESRTTATITYLQVDRVGHKRIVNEGGGSPNVRGCTLLNIVSDTGIYVAHIWEQPTFYMRHDTSTGARQQAAWEKNIHKFFREGATHPAVAGKPNYGPFPDSPSLVSLTRPYKPFHKFGRKFLDIVIFTVGRLDMITTQQYPQRINELKAELGGLLSFPMGNMRVQVYSRPKRPTNPLGFDLALAWQLASKQPKDKKEQYCLRTFWNGTTLQDDLYFEHSENKDHCSFKVTVDASERDKLFKKKKLKLDISVYDKTEKMGYNFKTDYLLKDKQPIMVKKGATPLNEDLVIDFTTSRDKLDFGNYHVQFKMGNTEWRWGVDVEAHPASLPRCLGGEWENERREPWCHFEC